MKFTAAFLWDSTAKTISYMAIDKNCDTRIKPKKEKIPSSNFKTYAEKIIDSFFVRIQELHQSDEDKIKIEYKILGHGAPAYLIGKFKKASEDSQHIKSTFMDKLNAVKDKIKDIKLMKQCRSKLKKDALKEFNNELNNLGLIKKEKGNAYEYHLWALILRATKTTYKDKMRKLQKALMKQSEKIEKKKLPSIKRKRHSK